MTHSVSTCTTHCPELATRSHFLSLQGDDRRLPAWSLKAADVKMFGEIYDHLGHHGGVNGGDAAPASLLIPPRPDSVCTQGTSSFSKVTMADFLPIQSWWPWWV